MKNGKASTGLIAIAVGYQWIYNGINFLAFKVGVEALPPFFLSALRFAIAGLLLLPFAAWRLRRGSFPSLRELGAAVVIGLIMLVGSQAVAIWGVQYLSAGVAAVLSSVSPFFLALFAWLFLHEPLSKRQVTGVAVGFAGLVLIGIDSHGSAGFKLVGAIAVLGASAAWAGGSLIARRLTLPRDAVVDLTAQLLAAGLLLSAITVLKGDVAHVDLARVPGRAWGALAFLIVASTLVGYGVFLWLNRTASSTLANTFFYVAPVIAMGLSAIFLDEPMDAMKIVAAAIALVGVALMVGGSEKRNDRRKH